MPLPSESSALLPTSSSSDALRAKLKEAAGGDGLLQKSEFQSLLLGRGIRIKQAVLEDIFTACDKDGDGSLSVDEIFHYVDHQLKPLPLFWDGIYYTAHKTTSSLVWWFAVAFHFAAWVGIVSFLYHETGRSIRPEWSIVGAWFFFFGAVYFFKLLWDHESTNYDTMHRAKMILQHTIVTDPTFFDNVAGKDASMDLYELNTAFEEQALYLPKSTLTQIFVEIDTDHSGSITKEEMVHFAKAQTIDPTRQERQAAIHKAVVRTWGFWSLICWFLGSILFLVGAHLSYAGYSEPPLPHNTYLHLYGMGSVLYWLLAFCMIPMLQTEAADYLESIDQMSKAFTARSLRMGHSSDKELFESLDVRRSYKGTDGQQITGTIQGESDGNLDVTELYDALIEEGVLIPYDTFLELFQDADESGDGELQVDEFTQFIAKMNIAKEPLQYTWQMIKYIPFAPSFFGVFMFFIGGFFYTMGSYVDVAHNAGWYFGGAICYGLASGNNVLKTVKNHWLHFRAVEAGKAQFKARIAAGLPPIV